MPRFRGKDQMSMDLYIYALCCKSHFDDSHHFYSNNFDTALMSDPCIEMACIQNYQFDDDNADSSHDYESCLKVRYL